MRRTIMLDASAEAALRALTRDSKMTVSEAIRYALISQERHLAIEERLDRIEARLSGLSSLPATPEPPAFDVGGFLGAFDGPHNPS